jgi:hypothetical protein
MPDIPEPGLNPLPAAITPYTFLPELTAYEGTTGSRSWPVANKALFFPFAVEEGVTVYRMTFYAGNSGGGNFDVGIYDLLGNRIVSSGSFAGGAGAGAFNSADLVDTVLSPNYYFMAMACDVTGATSLIASVPSSIAMAHHGVCELVSGMPLPSVAALVKITSNFLPCLNVNLKSVV